MNNETFIYMGGDMVVPQDIVRVRVHPSVTVIPGRAFNQRFKLEEIELCEGLLEIGTSAFGMSWGDEGSSLKQVSIPSSVKVIGDWAFNHCEKLEKVILCEGLLEIGSHAFSHCSALKSIRIPSTLTSIHNDTFAFCGKLEDVHLSEGPLEIGEFAFYGNSLSQINIPSTVSKIGKGAFKDCEKLAKLELSEGLVEIGEMAFCSCNLYGINIPSTVKSICGLAFAHVPLKNLSLPDGIESIGNKAFCNGDFTTVRIPPFITTVTETMCRGIGMFSIELPESIEKINEKAFACVMLRNFAIPLDTEIENDAFKDCEELKQLGTERNIINALQHRFDNLPIHKMLYYQSYGQRITRDIIDAPSIKQQDTLGMTPLHILACSTKQNIELYKMFIEKHPESLITKDKWGALPLLYAIWGNVDKEIVQFLVQSYKSIFPNYVLNWNMMMETLGKFSAEGTETRCLHNIQKDSFPNQFIDLDTLLENAITRSKPDHSNYINRRALRCFTTRSVSTRGLAIRYKPIRLQIMESIRTTITPDTIQVRRDYVENVYKKLEICEDKYNRMMEALTMFELLLWKNKMDDCCGQQSRTRRSKKMRLDDSDMRKQCRIKCGAETNIVIEHVLPYLDIL